MTLAQLSPEAPEAPPNPSAVVVNDDATQRQVLAGLLHKEGFIVRTFESAETALEAMQREGAPELIVTDIYMPGIDGWRFCRLLRSPEYAPLNPVPILVVSATYTGEETTRLTHELGANAFLPMPVDGPQFLETVRALLRGEKPRAGLKVLIVEDSKLISRRLLKAFQAQGYLAETAFTFQAGLTLIGQTVFDIAVLDYHLPDGQGDALLTVLQEQSPDCVCVMMTADPQPELALTWMKMGAAAYLQKPFEPDYLIAQCERARRERALLRVQALLERRTRELRESEAQYRLIADTMADTISVLDLRTRRFTYVSPSIVRLRGFTVEETRAQTFDQFFTPASLQLALQTLDEELRLEAGGTATPDRHRVVELEEYRKDGSTIWVSSTLSFLRDEARQPVALLVLSRDITERKRAEQALQQEKNALAKLLSVSEEFLEHPELEIDYQTMTDNLLQISGGQYAVFNRFDPNGRDFQTVAISGLNEHFQKATAILGFELAGKKWPPDEARAAKTRDNLITRFSSLVEISGDALPGLATALLRKLFNLGEAVIAKIQAGELVLGDFTIIMPAGETFAADNLVSIYVRQIGLLLQRKQAEDALRQLNAELEQRVEARTAALNTTNQQLVQALRIKDEFLAAMSHELRTPLTAILGVAELLQMQTSGPLNDKQAAYAQTISQSGQHLLALINDVLDLARLTAGQTPLELDLVNLSEACRVALQRVKPQADKKQITVSLVLDPAVTRLQADERRLKQILVNLLSNAVKFTPAGGQVGLTVSGEEKQCVVEFIVWDTGIGIAAEDLSRLFQDFVQLDARLARNYEGTGLGLSLVKRLVELHGGQVQAESDGLGKGSRFTVSLPWGEA